MFNGNRYHHKERRSLIHATARRVQACPPRKGFVRMGKIMWRRFFAFLTYISCRCKCFAGLSMDLDLIMACARAPEAMAGRLAAPPSLVVTGCVVGAPPIGHAVSPLLPNRST